MMMNGLLYFLLIIPVITYSVDDDWINDFCDPGTPPRDIKIIAVESYFQIIDMVDATLSVGAVATAYVALEPIFIENFCALGREVVKESADALLEKMYKRVMHKTAARSSFIMKRDIKKLNEIASDLYWRFIIEEKITPEGCIDTFREMYRKKYCSHKTHVYALLDGPKMMEMAKESLLHEGRTPEQDIQ